jgi:hypothetical protein
MPDGVDPTMEHMEAPGRHAMVDRLPAEAQLRELPSGHHAVLGRSDPGDGMVTWSTFALHIGVDVDHVSHAAQVGAGRRAEQHATATKLHPRRAGRLRRRPR